MKIKNLNLVERHVEKVVLATALLGAAYIAYQGLEPTTITAAGSRTLRPGEVAPAVQDVVAKVKDKEARTLDDINKQRLRLAMQDWVALYLKQVASPLPSYLLSSDVRFLPPQIPVIGGPPTTRRGPDELFAVILPPPPAVEAKARVGRGVIVESAAAVAAAPTTAASQPAQRDAKFAQIVAYYPVQKWREQVASAPENCQSLDPKFQTIALISVDFQRQERTVDGNWPSDPASWTPINRPKMTPPQPIVPWEQAKNKADIDQVLKILRGYLPTLTNPPMYQFKSGEIFPPVAPSSTATPATGPAAKAAPAPAAGDPLMGQELVVLAYDEGLQPEHEYRYRVRFSWYNPTFKFASPKRLQDPASAEVPYYTSEWVETNPVSIEPDSVFFLTGNGVMSGRRDAVDVRLYRFHLGRWYGALQYGAGIGEIIGARIEGKRPVSFDTGSTVVDVIPSTSSNSDATVVLLNSAGQLVTRNVVKDRETWSASPWEERIKSTATVTPTATQPSRQPIKPPPTTRRRP